MKRLLLVVMFGALAAAVGWADGGFSLGMPNAVKRKTKDLDAKVTQDSGNTSFAPPVLSVTVSGYGTATSSPVGISCAGNGTGQTGTCSASFPAGTRITLTEAVPNNIGRQPESDFVAWSGYGCSAGGTCSFTINSNSTVSASFRSYTLTVSCLGGGTGGYLFNAPFSYSFCGVGSGCSTYPSLCPGSVYSASYAPGAQVSMSAYPFGSSTFTWSGGGCSGTATCVVTMTSSQTVSATFVSSFTLAVALGSINGGYGIIVSQPAGISCSSSGGNGCSASFPIGTSVTLTNSEQSPLSNIIWTGGGCSGTGSCTLILNANTSVTGNICDTGVGIDPATYTLTGTYSFVACSTSVTVSAWGGGGGGGTGYGNITYGPGGGGGGGGGGGYSSQQVSVTPGKSYTIVAGGPGLSSGAFSSSSTASSFSLGSSILVSAQGGQPGGYGENGACGGGGCGGSGGNGSSATGQSGTSGNVPYAGNGGNGGSIGGGLGGVGGSTCGNNGATPGGGGAGGAGYSLGCAGGYGGNGEVIISW